MPRPPTPRLPTPRLPTQWPTPAARDQARRLEGQVADRADRLRRRARGRERLHPAQAGADVRDPQATRQRGRSRSSAIGVVEVLQDGFGFLRSSDANYLAGPDDIYVSPLADQALRPAHRRYRRGADPLSPKEGERYFALLKVGTINFEDPEKIRHKVHFDNLTPALSRQPPQARDRGPDAQARLQPRGSSTWSSPIGKGQRALIVAPPRTGKTVLLQNIAQSVTTNHPECLPDRAAHRRAARGGDRHAALGEGRGRVSSTFDEPADAPRGRLPRW